VTLDGIQELAASANDPAQTLSAIVAALHRSFLTDVCSVYLLGPDRAHLVLAATVGLRPESVGKVSMRLDEGLVGLVAQELRPIVVADARRHARFKYFADAGEDPYRSFLGVPLVDRGLLQGVLVVQTAERREFSGDAVQRIGEAAHSLGPIVRELRGLEQLIAPTYERLWSLARNLWWTWDSEASDLFRELDPVRWRQLAHNPIALLAEMPFDELEQRVGQNVLTSRIGHAHRRMLDYLGASDTWGDTHAGVLGARPVAYLSAEFGLHESMPIYSGGLGVLAGDHVKSASDLGVPLIGVGLFYRQGYFHQQIDADGWQNENYLDVDAERLPLEPALGRDGRIATVVIETRGASLHARVWKCSVGRTPLLLLDSDVPENQPEDRELTARLYGGDASTRVRQELMLGVGGIRALSALGIRPGVLHLNEGHSAFALLEVTRECMEREGVGFEEAARRIASCAVFTTHTPVPAGHDRFPAELVEEYLGPLRERLGLSYDQLLGLGRVHPEDPSELFCMTVLALRLSARANGVSSLHGRVSRQMWSEFWPGRAVDDVPIGHVTNGVHVRTWLAPAMHALYDRHLGPEWTRRSAVPEVWAGIDRVSDAELWDTHQALKARLLDFARRRITQQARRNGAEPATLDLLVRALGLDTLTIGFARRFAEYKRGDLVLEDVDRLAGLVNHPTRPVQLIFAGKAHPHDGHGKQILRAVAELASDARFVGKLVFLEDYDVNTARHLVQGVDVWLNTPRRPLEASGTSGQKVVLNGGLNLSVLDGWWAEAYDGRNGFAIGAGDTQVDTAVHDRRDAEDLYATLREQVIPLYYERDGDGLPRRWLARMKRAVRTLGWRFNADRMVMDYVTRCYVPAGGGTSCQMP
jgi:starch phosphorylase